MTTSSTDAAAATSRLLIVANRLPLSMSVKRAPVHNNQQQQNANTSAATSEITFTQSSGGLVSALAGSGLKSIWIGWPGGEVKQAQDRTIVRTKLKELNAVPVFLGAELCDQFYNGFCNDLLWPLFHYNPLSVESLKQHDLSYKAYQRANAEFARVVLDHYQPGDLVWVHDYHLMLLPALLRQAQPDMKIGFFLHTPFPSSEIYRVIPSRNDLLQGVLGANLLGFHTHDYARHFASSATRIIGAQCTNESIRFNNQISTITTCPIGIDPQKFLAALQTQPVREYLAELKQQFAGRHVLLGIDRLDYIKGIPQKLQAFDLFLARYPEFVGKVVLVQIAVPSRSDVLEYQRLKTSTHQLVGLINGKYSSLTTVPIIYLDQSIPFDKMCAMFSAADALVVTSLRDGMNLVAYEYIACQQDHHGVLIISEFAGAAQSLGAGALQINPNNYSEVCDAIHKALTMSAAERQQMTAYSFAHVMSHTAKTWATEFVEQLENLEHETSVDHSASSNDLQHLGEGSARTLPLPLDVEQLCRRFADAKHRLIITGLAGIHLRAKAQPIQPSTVGADEPISHTMTASNWDEYSDYTFELKDASSHDNPDASKQGAGSTLSGPSRYRAGQFTRRPSASTLMLQQGSGALLDRQTMEEWQHADGDVLPDVDALSPNRRQTITLDELKASIVALADDPRTTYFVLTSRTRQWCDALFSGITPMPRNLWIGAENGYFFKHGAAEEQQQEASWHVMYENVNFNWFDGVLKAMNYFCERTPRSYIQVQETNLAWHYDLAEPVFATRQALDLIAHLSGGPLTNTSTEIIHAAAIVQVRPLAVSKGRALKHLLRAITARNSSSARRADAAKESESMGEYSLAEPSSAASSSSPVSSMTMPIGVRSRHSSVDLSGATAALSAQEQDELALMQQHQQQLHESNDSPFNFIVCVGNFLDLDENIHELLEEWNQLGQLPSALQPHLHGGLTAAGALRGASNSLGTPVGGGVRHLGISSPSKQTLTVSIAAQTVPSSPQFALCANGSPLSASAQSLAFDASDPISPACSSDKASSSSASNTAQPGTPAIYTVTIGQRKSKARHFLSDLSAVNELIVRLAKNVNSSGEAPHS